MENSVLAQINSHSSKHAQILQIKSAYNYRYRWQWRCSMSSCFYLPLIPSTGMLAVPSAEFSSANRQVAPLAQPCRIQAQMFWRPPTMPYCAGNPRQGVTALHKELTSFVKRSPRTNQSRDTVERQAITTIQLRGDPRRGQSVPRPALRRRYADAPAAALLTGLGAGEWGAAARRLIRPFSS